MFPKKAKVQVGKLTFTISAYCYKKVGMTENMKFRLVCKQNPEFSGEFDDYQSLMDELNKHIFSLVIDTVL